MVLIEDLELSPEESNTMGEITNLDLSQLPLDIIVHTLKRISRVKSLLELKLVSKNWSQIISNPYLAQAHLKIAEEPNNLTSKRHIFFYKGSSSCPLPYITFVHYQTLHIIAMHLPFAPRQKNIDFLASFHGLLLFGGGEEGHFLWNPSTGLYKKILGQLKINDCCRLYGIGYDPRNEEYKVLRVIRLTSSKSYLSKPERFLPHNYDRTNVKVYNCKTDSWSKINEFPYKIFVDGQGANVKGAPHYLVTRDDPEELKNYVIIYFDVAEETFKEVPKPNWLDKDSSFGNLGVLGGMLCLVRFYEEECQVWVMREYGLKDSWTMLFAVSVSETLFSNIVPLYFINNQEVMLVANTSDLISYNIQNGTIRTILSIFDQYIISSAGYVDSLVWPYAW